MRRLLLIISIISFCAAAALSVGWVRSYQTTDEWWIAWVSRPDQWGSAQVRGTHIYSTKGEWLIVAYELQGFIARGTNPRGVEGLHLSHTYTATANARFIDFHDYIGAKESIFGMRYRLLVSILVTLGVLPPILLRRRRRPGFCRECGYDLRASPERCPECGTATPVRLSGGLGNPGSRGL
jgi:hypothetical protein